MPARPKKPVDDFAAAAAALRGLNRLDSTAQPKTRCPPGMIVTPYGEAVPRKKATVTQLMALDRENRGRAAITLPDISWGDVGDADIGLEEDPVAQLRAETYLKAVIGFNARRRAA